MVEELKRAIKKEPVTVLLIAFNILAFLIVEFTGGSENLLHMIECGAMYPAFVVEGHEYYRLFTSMFLHFGIQHLMNNMLVLFVIGQRLEPIIGKIRMVLIYILSGIGANIFSLYFEMKESEMAVSAGASGAVFAVMGAMLYIIVRHKGRVADLSIRQMTIMLGFSLYFGFTSSGVDNMAHIGGMVAGFLLAILLYHPRKTVKTLP